MKFKTLITLSAATVVAMANGATNVTEKAADSDVNSGLNFHDEATGRKRGIRPKNIDGYSFDIAEQKSPREIDWLKRSKRGSHGNVTCYVDKDGIPTAVFVIGVAPISTTMIAVEAEDEAQSEAEANAKEAFALWMQEFVSVENVREQKRLIVRTNGKESSETETKTMRKFTQTANAQWRGMSLFADSAKDGRYVAIWRWSVKEQELAKMVEALTRDESPEINIGRGKGRKVDWKVEERPLTFREDD